MVFCMVFQSFTDIDILVADKEVGGFFAVESAEHAAGIMSKNRFYKTFFGKAVANFVDATSPTLYKARLIKHVGYYSVAGFRRVGLFEAFDSLTKGEFTVVPKFDTVVPNTHLNLCAGIVAVNDCVENSLAQCRFGHFKFLHTEQSFVMNRVGKIFRLQKVDNTVCHLNKVAFYHILKHQIALRSAKSADFKLCRGKISRRTFAKTKYGSIAQLAVVSKKVKIFEHGFQI